MSRKEDQWNKQGKHEVLAEQSSHISSYSMASTDVSKERRNFPGYESHTPYSLVEMLKGDTEGTTDTDVKTHKMGPGHGGNYTKIYQKHG